MSKQVLVTGGAGFIGSHLVERLLRDGCRVAVVDDCSTGSLDNLTAVIHQAGLRVWTEKISACKELDQLVRESACVYHLAAAVGVELVLRNPVGSLQTNVHETEAVLQAASRHQVPVLLTSTSEVYGRSTAADFSEGDDLLLGPPQVGRWGYACSKLFDEFLALAYANERSLPVVIARLFNTVGPRQTGRYGMVLPRFIAAAQAGRPLRVYGDGSQTRCFCHVDDAVEALVRLQQCPAARGQVFNVGTTDEISMLNLAHLVIEVLNSKSRVELVPWDQVRAQYPGFEELLRRRPRIDKLEKTVGFRPGTPLRTIIEKTARAGGTSL